jgi:hypothetical protein
LIYVQTLLSRLQNIELKLDELKTIETSILTQDTRRHSLPGRIRWVDRHSLPGRIRQVSSHSIPGRIRWMVRYSFPSRIRWVDRFFLSPNQMGPSR